MLDPELQQRFARHCTEAAFGYSAASTAAYASFADQVLNFWTAILQPTPPKREPEPAAWRWPVPLSPSPAPAAAWPRLIADLACSQVFLALVAPWFFALQLRALTLAGSARELAA